MQLKLTVTAVESWKQQFPMVLLVLQHKVVLALRIIFKIQKCNKRFLIVLFPMVLWCCGAVVLWCCGAVFIRTFYSALSLPSGRLLCHSVGRHSQGYLTLYKTGDTEKAVEDNNPGVVQAWGISISSGGGPSVRAPSLLLRSPFEFPVGPDIV